MKTWQVLVFVCHSWLAELATTGEKEWYFYSPRDRKYRNSTRPNRVTGAGFWKATGTDRPIYSSDSGSKCIGLKKSLVFYKGRAAKGIKTDWMMHEFRLPPPTTTNNNQHITGTAARNISTDQEAVSTVSSHHFPIIVFWTALSKLLHKQVVNQWSSYYLNKGQLQYWPPLDIYGIL